MDHNKNNKIDTEDPAIFYVSDTPENNLRALTTANENVVGMELYEKQQLALVTIQRDANKDGVYNAKDANYYYGKIDLRTLTPDNKIELTE